MKRKWRVGFGLLCLISGTAWVIPSTSLLPVLEEQGIRYGMIGLLGLILGWSGLRNRGWRGVAMVAAASVGFFAVPMVAVECARGSVGEITRAALFAMVPVVVVMAVAAMEVEERGAQRFLVPSLVGVGGLLLLLPLAFPGSSHGRVLLGMLVATVVLVGVCSVWLYRLLQGLDVVEAMAVAGLSNGFFFLICSVMREETVWRWSGLVSAVSLDALAGVVEVVLILWLVREMKPIRFASRYLIIPLVTVVESYVLQWPGLNLRMSAGTVLLALGAGLLLLWRPGDEEGSLSLR